MVAREYLEVDSGEVTRLFFCLLLINDHGGVIYGMKKPKKEIDKRLPTNFGALGKLLDDASSDLSNQFDSFLDSVEKGFKKFLSPPMIEKD